MEWFKRLRGGIETSSAKKKETPDGLWHQCAKCKETSTYSDLKQNTYKCPKCGFHERIGSKKYFEIIFDNGEHQELFGNIVSKDPLSFVDMKPYPVRIQEAQKKTDLKDALSVGVGLVDGRGLVIACMDFSFIGGSMGSVVGEKISRGIDFALEHNCAFMIISRSGGARMMESAFSLMQMAKTSAKLTLLAKAKLPYISLMTDPTTGGVTASYAMLGDINMAEPASLIGFAGPRVIRETIKRDLPEGFQTAEFLLEKGFLDLIVDRKDLRTTLARLIKMFAEKNKL